MYKQYTYINIYIYIYMHIYIHVVTSNLLYINIVFNTQTYIRI